VERGFGGHFKGLLTQWGIMEGSTTENNWMNRDDRQRTAVTETSVASISIFTAICLGLVVVLMTRFSFKVGLDPASLASCALLLAILTFIFSNDFFILRIFHPKHTFFAYVGSILYVFGEAFIIIGISMALKALATTLISYLFLGIFTVGFVTYNILRICKIKHEDAGKVRLIIRLVAFLLLVSGFVMI
jgi:hypothetical protein